MSNRKTMIHFFTIADYEEEENWLRTQHKKGWKLVKTVIPCFYIFERCTPEDVAYRLDYKNNSENGDYFQIFKDFGWEYFNCCMGWLYFRKPISQTDTEKDSEIFTDSSSRVNMVNHIFKTRMLPVMVLFFCCVLPNLIRSIEVTDSFSNVMVVILAIVAILDIFLITHCGLKLMRLKKKYGKT